MKYIIATALVVFPLLANAQESTAPTKTASAESQTMTNSGLRKREHRISGRLSSPTIELDVDGVGDSESDTTELSFAYGRNFGTFEMGASYGGSSSKDDDSESSSGLLTLYARANFIPNIPGNDFIPFAGLGIQSYVEDGEISSTDYDFKGRGFGFEIGFTWFPLGEIFALEVGYSSSSISGDLDMGASDFDTDVKVSGLSVSYSLFF